MGMMKSRAGRPRRDAERLGDLGRAEAQVVLKHEDRPLLGRQPAEATFELVPVGQSEEMVRRGRSVDRQDTQVRRAAAFARRLFDADVDEHSMEPRVEAVRIAEPPQITPGDHQRILQSILGPIDVAEDPVGDRVQAVGARRDQVDERGLIPTLGRTDEIEIHRASQLALIGSAVRYRWWSLGCCRSFFVIRPDVIGRWRGFSAAILGSVAGLSGRRSWMAELYPWFVVVHLVGLVLFAISHGASAFMSFRLRGERDPVVADALLRVGQLSIGPMYIGLLLLIVGGLGAAAGANLWGKTWVIASIVVFIVVLVVMWAVASPYYMGLRKALEERGPDRRPAIEPSALARQLDTRRPEILSLVGTVGLVLLVWLMVIKPG